VHNKTGTNILIAIATVNITALKILTPHYKEILKDKVITDKSVLEYCKEEIYKIAKVNVLKEFEIPKGIILINEEWTPTNGYLTTSFKVVRHKIFKTYSSQIINCLL